MDSRRVKERIRTGEDSASEFKGLVHKGFTVDDAVRREIAKAIVAFANSGGGLLLLGVESDRSVTGLGTPEQADRVQRDVGDVCQSQIEPPLTCRITKAEVDGVLVLAVEVVGWHADRPYRSKADHIRYVREGSRSREARAEEEKSLLVSGARVYHDEELVPETTIDDLDLAEAQKFLARTTRPATGPEEIKASLRAFKCLTRRHEPTVGGILLFGKDVPAVFPDARITLARFSGVELSTTSLDRKEIEGRLPDQLEGARALLALHLPMPTRVEGWVRKEAPGPGGIPATVLREAIVNALMHRDYRIASQIRVFVFADRVEISNPGTLLNELDLENVRVGGISQRRNPVIANVLLRYQTAELQGSGIPLMIKLATEAGLREPLFECVGGHFKVTLWTATPRV